MSIDPDRYQTKATDEGAGKFLAESVLMLATQEEEVFDYPDNFLTKLGKKWHTFKLQYLRWLGRFCPLGITRVWMIHKFPELNTPPEYFGREFVHFREVKDIEKEIPQD